MLRYVGEQYLQKDQVLEVERTYSREPASVLSAEPTIKQPKVRGRVIKVSGPGKVSLGIQPIEAEERKDWVIVFRKF